MIRDFLASQLLLVIDAKIMATYIMPVTTCSQRVFNFTQQPMGDQLPFDAWDELLGLLLLPEKDSDGS